jgi:GTPase
LGTRTRVVCPYLARGQPGERGALRSPEARCEEAVGLARAIDLDVVGAEIASLGAIRPATYLGKGKVKTIAAEVKAESMDLVVLDCALSPVQQRNLEKAFGCKVIDRTGLILEIFGRRARTAEGALQVELAHLAYQRSRLVRSWTHLERQRGGFGFLGGPGETQIETDSRLIQERMVRIERELEGVKRTRALHRASRSDVPFPIVALIGYTNAGKSTLFNALTRAGVLSSPKMFATLDPTIRGVELPSKRKVLLSDTVGFIRNLPHTLVSAFRATLEEVQRASLILHVSDASSRLSAEQDAQVELVLKELEAENKPRLRVMNKVDLLDEEVASSLTADAARDHARTLYVSAVEGTGLDRLLERIDDMILQDSVSRVRLRVPQSEGKALAMLEARARIYSRKYLDGAVELEADAPASVVRRMSAWQIGKGQGGT